METSRVYKSTPARRASWARHRTANLEKRREATRTYRRNNPEKVKVSNRLSNFKRKKTVLYRLAHSLRNRILRAVKTNQKSGSAVKDLGCSVDQLKLHLEARFQPGMTWDNWGIKGWHIDHIIPLKYYDLTNREEYLKATHYTNLQPLWALDNLKKGDRLCHKI